MTNFEILNDEDLNQKYTKRDLATKYLGFIKDSDVILANPQSSKALEYVLNLFKTEITDIVFRTMSDTNQTIIVNTLVDLIKTELNKYFNAVKTDDAIKTNKIFNLLHKLLETLELLSRNSVLFCLKFHEQLKLNELFQMVQIVQDEFKETMVTFAENQLKNLILSILNMSQLAFKFKDLWTNCELIFSKFLNKLNNLSDYFCWYIFLINENVVTNFSTEEQAYKQSLSFEIKSKDKKENIVNKCNLGFKYLLFLKDPFILLSSEQSMNIIYYISAIQNCFYDDIQTNIQSDCVQLIVNLIIYLHNETVENVKLNCEATNKKTDKIIRKNLVFIEKLVQIVQEYSNVSINFCIEFSKTKDAIKYLFKFIQSECLSDYLCENLTKKVSSFILKGCFDVIIGALQNLSHTSLKFKSLWDDADSVQSCIRFSDKLGTICHKYRSYVYMIIANIASDSEIDTLLEIRVALNNITDLIKSCAKELDSTPEPKRIKIQLEQDKEMEEIIYTKIKNEINFHLVELLTALYHLAVNDNIKQDIYEKCSMRKSLKIIILKGNEVEKEFALQLLYQLCFDENIAKKVSKNQDLELVDYLKTLVNDQNLKRKNIIKHCNGIFWMINNKDAEHTVKQTIKNEPGKHLMISYNRESRDLCLCIKSGLEKKGYKIWIDVEDIHGSSLESMAFAIEQSACVLMCMTEKYKLSSNCRLEAEYAVAINKPIIPLILQKDYKPDGWLGIILGSKMFINFMKYEFDECIRRLKNEIVNIYKQAQTNQEIKTDESIKYEEQSVQKNNLKKRIEWTENEVEKWLNSKNFKQSIVKNIRPCNGKILYQLYSMLQNAPEFFYSSLKSEADDNVILKDLALFSYELNCLFDD